MGYLGRSGRELVFGTDPDAINGMLNWILGSGARVLSQAQLRTLQDLVGYAARLIQFDETELVPVRYARSFDVLNESLNAADMDRLERLFYYQTSLNRQIVLKLEVIEGLKRRRSASV